MSNCPSNKNSYDTIELAEEALLQNHMRHHHSNTGGPINVYLCRDCDSYHFTSKGQKNEILLGNEVQDKIKLERQANYWEGKLR